MDCDIMDFDKDSRIMMLTSGGCNVLDYVIEGAGMCQHEQRLAVPACCLSNTAARAAALYTGEVVAVDLNPRQNALLEMKMACIHALPYDKFWALFSAEGAAQEAPWFEFRSRMAGEHADLDALATQHVLAVRVARHQDLENARLLLEGVAQL